ncbi:hypothetical protein ACFL52_04785, partial [Candidatus Margulisiibacteriota bacterium]
QLKALGIKTDNTTFGILPGDPYSEEAAIKCGEEGIPFKLSVHLMQKRLFPSPDSVPTDEALDEYARTVLHTINTLVPTEITFLGDMHATNRYLSGLYVMQFYHERVLPYLSKDLQEKYNYPSDLRPRLAYDGRLQNNPYFPWTDKQIADQRGYTIYGSKYGIKVDPSGKTIVLAPTRKFLTLPNFKPPLMVKDRFQAADSREFKSFLLKLQFAFSDKSEKENVTVDIWKKYFPEFMWEELYSSFGPFLGLNNLSTETCKGAYSILGDLPIVSAELFYDFYIADLEFGDDQSTNPPFLKYYLWDYRRPSLFLPYGEEGHFLSSFKEGKDALERTNNIEEGPIAKLRRKKPDQNDIQRLRIIYEALKGFPIYAINNLKEEDFVKSRSKVFLSSKARIVV